MAIKVEDSDASSAVGSYVNGHAKTGGSLPRKRSQQQSKKVTSTTAWLTSLVTRAAVWYCILTLALRCPLDATGLTGTSPKICRPYVQLRGFAKPYIQPLYTAHIEPHLQKYQPYLDQVRSHYVQPASTLAQDKYASYAAPVVQRAQGFGQKQWDSTVLPQLHSLQAQAGKQYKSTLSPYVDKADAKIRPHYRRAYESVNDFWELELRPAYKFAAPRVAKGYRGAQKTVNTVLLPQSRWLAGVVWSALDRHALPMMRVLYGENVEPQIMRIKQRLGRYKDEKKIEAAFDAEADERPLDSVVSSAVQPPDTTASTTIAPTASSVKSSVPPSSASIDPPAASSAAAADLFTQDLDKWHRQVNKAIEQAQAHLQERISDICAEQTGSQIEKVGNALLVQLEESGTSSARAVRHAITAAVAKLPEDAIEQDVTHALKDIEIVVRQGGGSVRAQAQKIRVWRKTLVNETASLIEAAGNSAVETVDNIRELRLQEIGRKWASNDDISHRDWSSYNRLKRDSASWATSIADTLSDNKDYAHLRAAGAELEDRAMAVAEDAAKELTRLKGVALWKLRARDETDNFEDRIVPPVVAKVVEQVKSAAGGASQAVLGSSQGTVESLTSSLSSQAGVASVSMSETVIDKPASLIADASSSAAELGSSISDALAGLAGKAASSGSSFTNGGMSSISSRASAAFSTAESASDESSSTLSSSLGSASSQISSSASPILEQASSSAGSETRSMSSPASVASSMASSASSIVTVASDVASSSLESLASVAISSASAVISGTTPAPASSSIASLTDAASSDIESAESQVSSNAAASSNRSVKTSAKSAASSLSSFVGSSVLPDSSSISSSVSSSSSVASSAVAASSSSISSQISDAAPSADIVSEKIKSASSKVFGGAMAQAVPAREPVFDEPLDTASDEDSYLEAAMASARDQFDTLTSAASEAIYGKQSATGSLASVSSVADELFESAVDAARSIFYGPEPTGMEKPLVFAKEKYAEAVSAASSAFYSTPTTALDVMETARSKISELAAQASSQFSAASAYASSNSAQAASHASEQIHGTTAAGALASVQSVYSNALKQASDQLQLALAKTSVFASQTQAPFASITSIASSRLAYGLQLAKNNLMSVKHAAGLEPTPTAQSMLNEAQRMYYERVGYAHDQYSSYVTSASRALKGAGQYFGPTTTPVYEQAFSSAQSQYAVASSAAASALAVALSSVSSVAGAKQTTPAQSLLHAANKQYSNALTAAQRALGTSQEPVYNSMMSAVESRYDDAASAAQDTFDRAMSAARAAVGMESQAEGNMDALLRSADEQYQNALSVANEAASKAGQYASGVIYGTSTGQVEAASKAFSSFVYGTDPAWTASAASQASENWNAIIHQASRRIYAKPTPYYEGAASQASSALSQATESAASVLSQATSGVGSVAAQVTSAVGQNYDAVYALFASLISGQEPDYTDKMMAQLSSAYYTGAGKALSSASSAASSAYSVASSAAGSVFTTPATVDDVLQSVTGNIDALISAASEQVYGTPQGTLDKATSAIADAGSSAASAASSVADRASSAVSSLVSGPPASQTSRLAADYYSSLLHAAGDANSRISSALFATPTASAVSDRVSSAASVVTGVAGSVASGVSSMLFGAEKTGAYNTASDRIASAMASASRRVEEIMAVAQLRANTAGSAAASMAADAVEGVKSSVKAAVDAAGSQASSASEAVSSAVNGAKDEL